MKLWVVISLCVLNVVLLISNGVLAGALRRVTGIGLARQNEMEVFQREAERLEVLRVRLEDKLDLITSQIRFQRPVVIATPQAETSQSPEEETQRSDLMTLPALSSEEKEYLDQLRSEMPDLSDAVLLTGDVEAILRDKAWNPKSRELDAEEKVQLKQLADDYRFYSRVAPYERVRRDVRPEVARMRESGAYVDYPVDAKVVVPGIKISHGEMPADKPGIKRIYLFHPNDYPELYHRKRVEQERSLEAFVKIYHLVNGSL